MYPSQALDFTTGLYLTPFYVPAFNVTLQQQDIVLTTQTGFILHSYKSNINIFIIATALL